MDGIYQVVIAGVNAQGQFASNVSHWQVTGSSAGDEYSTANDLATAVSTAAGVGLAPCMGSDANINICYAKKIDGTGGASIFAPTNIAGMTGPASLSIGVAADIAFYPGGAKNRPGHWYAWALEAAGVVGDAIQTALLTKLTTWANTLLAPLTLGGGGTATFGTWTRKTKTFTTATHFNIKPKLTMLNKRTVPLY